MVWLPRLVVGESRQTAIPLFEAAWDYLRRLGIEWTKVILPLTDRAGARMAGIGGFRHLANLLYLVAPDNLFSTATRVDLEFESYTQANHERLTRVIAATYENSFDCIGCEGMSSPEDMLASSRSSGGFDPRHWSIVRHQNCDVGCLLLCDHPRHGVMELRYLGFIPEARGRGWCRHLMDSARRISDLAGRRLVLAVDAANAPMVQTLMGLGFATFRRRRLFVRAIPPTGVWHTSSRQVIHASFPSAEAFFSALRAFNGRVFPKNSPQKNSRPKNLLAHRARPV